MDIIETMFKGLDWIQMADSNIIQRAFVNAVVKFPVL
jgi:hypothetical protein